MSNIILDTDLSLAKKEYVELGTELQLFRGNTISSTECRLRGTDIRVDNTIPGDARTKIDESGKPIILVNTDKCLAHAEKHYLDEVLFHEFSHINNEVQRDLYVYRAHRIMGFKEDFKRFATDLLVRYPEWGFILLDEIIAQYTAQQMTELKHGKGTYKPFDFVMTDITKTKYALGTKTTDYPECHKFADRFAKTVYDDENPMFELCKDAYDHNLLDNIFNRYKNIPNGVEELYHLLGYMGNIMLAIYEKKYGFRYGEASDFNTKPENVEQSMILALKMSDRLAVRK